MTTDTVTSDLTIDAGAMAEVTSSQAEDSAPPYPPSWVDRLSDWLEGLPGPTWAAYLGLMVIAVAVSLAEPAIDAEEDPAIWVGGVFWGVVLPLSLWLFAYLSNVAGSAFDDFRPALATPDAAASRLRYRLTVTPARPALLILVASGVFDAVYYLFDPVASNIVGLSPIGLAARFAAETFFGGLILVLVYQAFRQLRDVSRIHASAARIDLFRPTPLYAFSRYTSRAAIAIALIVIVPSLVGTAQSQNATSFFVIVLPWILAGFVAAAVVFVMPLRGMQQRITAEKRRLQTEVGIRIEDAIETMHDRIDADDPAGARAQHEVLQALVMERDLVEKLPTLPWRAGTLGAVISAVVAPLALFVVTRLLERVI